MEEPDFNMLATPGLANALFTVSPERMNQQRHFQVPTSPSLRSSFANRVQRNSFVQEKAAHFDTVMQATTQNIFAGKALERKANDKALERAMLGREEAESEMRKWRDQANRNQESILALGRDNEKLRQDKRKVSERYELLMVCFYFLVFNEGSSMINTYCLLRKNWRVRRRTMNIRKRPWKHTPSNCAKNPSSRNPSW